jgi:hypothetical protein
MFHDGDELLTLACGDERRYVMNVASCFLDTRRFPKFEHKLPTETGWHISRRIATAAVST